MERIDGVKLKKEITIDDIAAAEGGVITFSACVHKLRNSGSLTFVLLRTGRYVLQSVYTADKCMDDFEALREGAYVTVTGVVKKEERASYGYEITLSSFEILSTPKEEYPLNISSPHSGWSVETSMRHRNAALRHPEERAVFKISEGVTAGFRAFLMNEGFTEIHTPKITAVNAEGGSNMFKLKYFGRNAYLAQSPQLYKQSCAAVFDRVFEIGSTYRAEKHNSARHLNEYISLDFEMAYIDDIHDVMAMETAMLKYVMKYLGENYKHEIDMLHAELPVITDIPSVTFYEAVDILGKPRSQPDLDPTDEDKLCTWAKENYGSEFIFVEKCPAKKRPFYIMDSKDNPDLTESFDLLLRGIEVSSGGQRIHDYDEQLDKLKRFKLDAEKLGAYLDIHRCGMPPHGGLGIGLERLVMKLLGLENIRQASLFPRDLHHLDP